MPYKPKFCNQCGENIDSLNRKWWNSGRFCDFCSTEFGIYDKAKRFLYGITLLLALYGIGSYFHKPEKQLSVVSHPTSVSDANSNSFQSKSVAQIPTDATVQTSLKSDVLRTQTNAPPASSIVKLKSDNAAAPTPKIDKVYFCGATTKKGTMCSRRVKNGGRCWQHEGQTAQLPQEDLLAAR